MLAYMVYVAQAQTDSSPSTWLTIALALIGGGAITTIFTALLDYYKTKRDEEQREFERDKAVSEAPLVQESLALGNVDKAVAIQQGIIKNLEDHITYQDREIQALRDEKDREIRDLRERLRERDEQIDRMESMLMRVRTQLRQAQGQIDVLDAEIRRLKNPTNGSNQ